MPVSAAGSTSDVSCSPPSTGRPRSIYCRALAAQPVPARPSEPAFRRRPAVPVGCRRRPVIAPELQSLRATEQTMACARCCRAGATAPRRAPRRAANRPRAPPRRSRRRDARHDQRMTHHDHNPQRRSAAHAPRLCALCHEYLRAARGLCREISVRCSESQVPYTSRRRASSSRSGLLPRAASRWSSCATSRASLLAALTRSEALGLPAIAASLPRAIADVAHAIRTGSSSTWTLRSRRSPTSVRSSTPACGSRPDRARRGRALRAASRGDASPPFPSSCSACGPIFRRPRTSSQHNRPPPPSPPRAAAPRLRAPRRASRRP